MTLDINSSSVEIERKFLIRNAPTDLDEHPSKAICQGYLAACGADELRIRRRGSSYTLTRKSGSGMTRIEREIELPSQVFDELWPLTEGRQIHKTRYEIAYRGVTIELDKYRGNLTGLQVAEVEFASTVDADRFEPPAWFDREITDDPAFKNRALAETSGHF